jgi:hypothetical protein
MADIKLRSLEAAPTDIRLQPIFTPPAYPATDILLSRAETVLTDIRLLSQGQGYTPYVILTLYRWTGTIWRKANLMVGETFIDAVLEVRVTGAWQSVDTTGV